MSESPARIHALQPILAVPNVEVAVAFYRDVLDFADSWLRGSPATHGGAGRDRATFQFSRDPERAARSAAGAEFWLRVADIDALHALHRERGANVVRPLEETPWGFREYAVSDLNGYVLRFAEPTDRATAAHPRAGGETAPGASGDTNAGFP